MTGDQRYVISIRIIGEIRRNNPKLKMFMVSVLWSDEAEVIIYRSFQDFKKFHRQLKKKFPNFNPFKKSERMIPKFSGKARKTTLKEKGSKKSIRQMTFLVNYCDKLLKCDQSVTLSSEVKRFFTSKDHDLQQDFTKNTFMILMSDDLKDSVEGENRAGNVTNPFETKTYRCVAPYETKDTKNRPFKVSADEKVDVLIKDPAGWWLVESEDKRLAWFPAPYLEVLDGGDEDDDGNLAGSLFCAVKTYSTNKIDEVSVSIGSVVEVLKKSDDGWWLIRFNGKVGYIPSMYLQPYSNPRAGLSSLNRHVHSSSLNLGSTRETPAPRPLMTHEENIARRSSGGSVESRIPERLPRAHSLDVLSGDWKHGGSEASASDSNDSIFSDFSSSGESSLDSQEEAGGVQRGRLSDRSSSGESDGSNRSSMSGPRVPPRPKTEEILTRCTTMTRKAALINKNRLHAQKDAVHSR